MLTAHHVNAFLVIAACALSAAAGFLAWRRRALAGRTVAHLLALAQTLLVAQVGLGLLLLSDGRRAPDRLHYAYGSFALLAVLAPWLYAPAEARVRLAWFAGATAVAAALAVRAYMTA
jgi:hypothetical protein